MKITICILMAVMLICGCATSTFEADNNARLKLTKQMSPSWLSSNIVLGKTTQPEVHNLFGEPLFKNLSTGSSTDTNSIPFETWLYQGGWDKKAKLPLKFIVFNFTNDIVIGYK